MKSTEDLLQELNKAWEMPDKKSSDILSGEPFEKEVTEIINYFHLLFESALKQNRIDKQQWFACQQNILTVQQILSGKKYAPYFSKAMLDLTPDQTIQLFRSFTEIDARGFLALANQIENQYVELNAAEGNDTICFLYLRQHDNAMVFDRYADCMLPVNGNPEYCGHDNYLPIYKLIEKYFPSTTIRLITSPRQAIGRYIYIITFKHFVDFIASNANELLSVIPEQVLEDCRLGKAIIIYNDLAESTFYHTFFKSFQKQLTKAGIINSFFLLSGDWSNEPLQKEDTVTGKILSLINPAKKINLRIFNYFEEACSISKKVRYTDYTYQVKLNHIKNHTESFRHFICLNRIVKDYRLYISYFLYANSLHNKSFISQDIYTGTKDFQYGYDQNKALWNDTDNLQFEKFKASLPWYIDFDNMKRNIWDAVPIPVLNNSFCWIVTETSFANTLPHQSFRLTEKTYKPIAFFMPFIIVGNPQILKKLRQAGYRTFAKWWDESYDSIIDPIQRMQHIKAVILKIGSYSQHQLVEIYEEMQPVLIHNYELMMHSTSGKPTAAAIFKSAVGS